MTNVIRMKRGNVFTFSHQLRWSDNTPMSLVSATKVIMKMKKDGSDEYVVNDEMEVYDDVNGYVQRMWRAEEVSEPGMYYVEIEVTFSDGSVITVPSADILLVWIMEDI